MWYVEAVINYRTGETERWEGLTQEQSRAIHIEYSKQLVPMVSSGRM